MLHKTMAGKKKRKDLSEQKLLQLIGALFHASCGRELKRNTISNLCRQYDVSKWRVQRVWQKVKNNLGSPTKISVKKKY